MSKQCTYSQATVEDYSQTKSLDTRQLSLLSGIDMPAKSSEKEPQTDGSLDCKCGKGMSDCSIHPSTPESWTSFMQDSLAQTFQLLGQKQVYLREPDRVYTEKYCELLALSGQSNSSWKTYQPLFQVECLPYSGTWPRWGFLQDGAVYRHPMSEQIIKGTGGGYLPTPTTSQDYKPIRKFAPSEKNGTHGKMLVAVIGEANPQLVGQYLNPEMVEWMMGFPIGWTGLRELETLKSHSKQLQPTVCSEVSE